MQEPDSRIKAEFSGEDQHVLVITIDNPPVNAISWDMWDRLERVLDDVHEQPEVRCVVLTGAGERVFLAGADLKDLSFEGSPVEIAKAKARLRRPARRLHNTLHQFPVPIIAAVNGAAIGAGTLIATLCDFIIASEQASFAVNQIDLGGIAGGAHLKRILPECVIRRLVLTGDRVDGHFLKQFGAVYEVVPPAELMPAALRLAHRLALKSPATMRLRKEILNVSEDMNFTQGFHVEHIAMNLNGHPDGREAMRAAREKRSPVWTE